MSASVFTIIPSPRGALRVESDGRHLTALNFGAAAHDRRARRQDDLPLFVLARDELAAYFAGKQRCFTLPLRPIGTAFQRQVWRALCRIPHGRTISYKELATQIGRPTAFRAVANANGRNPLCILIPCHRVIGHDGGLGGYSGGLAHKRFLLRLEGSYPQACG